MFHNIASGMRRINNLGATFREFQMTEEKQ